MSIKVHASSTGKCGHNAQYAVIYYARIGGNSIGLNLGKP